ncbi:MAG TPA: SH3-like domain-containing protein [Stellaceae bacterium]|nr:SH3-like domain-containing protein [Stellaceae bacterium]
MSETSPAFQIGDRVRVKSVEPAGNPRTPIYIRGKTGVVIGIHGRIDNPVDHRGIYPPLYTVEFEVREVFGTASADRLAVDIHDDWLEAV